MPEFTITPEITFEVIDNEPFDGNGDLLFPGNFDTVVRGTTGEAAEFAEFDLSNFMPSQGEVVTQVLFQARLSTFKVFGLGVSGDDNPETVGIYGYVGNGQADASDLELGQQLTTIDLTNVQAGDILTFDITSYVQESIDNNIDFVGLGIRAEDFGGFSFSGANDSELALIISTEQTVELTGTEGNDILTGTNSQDIIAGLGGNDIIQGLASSDRISGGSGDDFVTAGSGNDTVIGNKGRDNLAGGDGNDLLKGGAGEDRILGEAGNDTIHGGKGKDIIDGGEGSDLVFGGVGDDRIFGGLGKDRLHGGSGADTLIGGVARDVLYGGDGRDVLIGVELLDSGANVGFGVGEVDRLIGGRERDTFVLGDKNRVYYDDGNPLADGRDDFAAIKDFDSNEDSIQLKGSAELYRLDFFTSDTGKINADVIFDPNETARGEVIATLHNVDPTLTTRDPAFIFV